MVNKIKEGKSRTLHTTFPVPLKWKNNESLLLLLFCFWYFKIRYNFIVAGEYMCDSLNLQFVLLYHLFFMSESAEVETHEYLYAINAKLL